MKPKTARALLVSKVNFLGDAVSFLPTLHALRRHFPHRPIVIVCTEVGRQVFLGAVDKIEAIVVDPQRVGRPLGLVLELIRHLVRLGPRRFDVSLHSYDEPSFTYILAALLRVPKRVGFDSGISKGQSLLTTRLPFRALANVADINFDLVRYATGRKELVPARVPIRYGAGDRQTVEQLLAAVGVRPKGFIVIHPQAKLPYREWGLANYRAVAMRLERELGIPCVVVTERWEPVISLRHRISGLNISQLAALFDLASLFIGNNSGPMHVAAAMGTPCLIIEGPTAPNWKISWSDVPQKILKATHMACLPCERVGRIPGKCANVQYPMGCMKEVTIEEVVAAAESLLSAHGAARWAFWSHSVPSR